MISLEAMGLENAQELTDFMNAAIGEFSGCFYRGATREPDPKTGAILTNAEVVESLKNHPKRRDLKTFSDQQAAGLGSEWKEAIVAAADSFVSQQTGQLKKPYQKMKAIQMAKIASARSWRQVGQSVLAIMKRRQREQLAASADGSESAAAKVSPGYAKWRERQYGVSQDRVYIATGQLMEDLSPDVPGRIALMKGQAALDTATANANVRAAVSEVQAIAGLGRGKMFK